MVDLTNKDIFSLTMAEWSALEDYQFESLLHMVAAEMSLCESRVRDLTPAFHDYQAAKDEFARARDIGKMLQSLMRSKKF